MRVHPPLAPFFYLVAVHNVASVQNLTIPHGAYVSLPPQKYAGLTKIMCHAYVSLSAEKYARLDVISPKLNAKQALHQTVTYILAKNVRM